MGVLLLFNAGFMFLSTLVSFIFKDGVTTEIFFAGLTILIVGLILLLINKNHEKRMGRPGFEPGTERL